MDERYLRGKIYTIRCRADETLIYVGATIETRLSARFCGHKRDKSVSLYKYINDPINNTTWDDWYIELHEVYPCTCRMELGKREGEVIREIATINKVGYGTPETYKENQKEYRDANKEQAKIYRNENKEHIAEHEKIYRDNNKEYILEQAKNYYENNKGYILEQAKNYYENNRKDIVEKSKIYYEINKKDIVEKSKIYYENNKDKIAERKKIYRNENKEKIAEYKKTYYEKKKIRKN